jgi:hypothetical protein
MNATPYKNLAQKTIGNDALAARENEVSFFLIQKVKQQKALIYLFRFNRLHDTFS